MSCKRYTPQNDTVESLLFDQLFDIVKDEDSADALYGFFKTDEFLEIFDDANPALGQLPTLYSKDPSDSIMDRTDVNEEPMLYFDKVLNKYYFLDKFEERVYYPHNQGLINLFSVEDIMTLREVMALKYYDTLAFDFDNKEFLNLDDSRVKTIIEDFLEYKADELLNDPDFYISTMYGNSVEMSKEYIDEWVQEVKDYFETKGLIVKKNQIEAEEEDDTTTAETASRTDLIRKEAFLVNRKDTVNNNVKLFLSLLKSKDLNKFNEYDFIPFDDVYTTLNSILANHVPIDDENGSLENVYEMFLDQIKRHATFKPYLKDLHDKIKTIDNINFKYQLVNAFFLSRKKFLGSDITIEKGTYRYDIKDLSDVSSRKKGVISNWNYLIDRGNITIQQFKELKNILNVEVKALGKQPTEEMYSAVFDKVLFNLTNTGVPLLPEALDYHIQINYGEELDDRIYGLEEVINNIAHAVSAHEEEQQIGELLTNSAFTKLAAAESFFLSEGSDASFFSAGKNKWLYSLYSHLEKTILEWQKNPKLLEDHVNSSAYTKGSHYAKHFLALDMPEDEREEESKLRLAEIETFVFNSVQIKNESLDAADNKNIFYVDSLADYINKMFNHLKPNGKTYHKTALAADKSTEYQLSWGMRPEVFAIQTNATITAGTFNVTKEVQEIFYEYFESEYYRMTEVHNAIDKGEKLVDNYHTGKANGKLSQLFPELSPTFSNGKATNPRSMKSPLYDETGRPIYEDLDTVKDEIMPIILRSIHDNVKDTMANLEDANISYYNVNGFRKFQGIDETVLDNYMGSARKAKKKLSSEEKQKRRAKIEAGFLQLAADLTVNSIISQVEYSKLITGDVAYYKNPMDYKKRVPASYTDGQYLTLLSNEEKIFNAAIIAPIEYETPNMALLKERLPERIWKQYTNVNATDGQAWITPERWVFIMKRLGKWNKVAQSLSKKMYEEKPVFTQKELNMLAQPLKGVYFSNIDGHPVYLKYSQAVLLPRLVKGTPLEKLVTAMEKSGTDELITLDGIKVGAITPTVTHNADGTIKDDIVLENMELSNAHWKLQQDLPTKGFKPRELGSQIQKNIFQGLAYNLFNEDGSPKMFTIGEQEVTGTEAIVYINDLFGALSNQGTTKLRNQLGIGEDNVITNVDGLFHSLLTQLKSRSSASKNVINALQARTSPFGIPGSYSIFQNIFSSLSNKASIKIKTNGGGFIQMADYGLSRTEAKKKGIIFTPWFEKNENVLSPPVIGKNPITGKDIIKPGGIFLSGSLIAKHIPNYASMPPNQLFGTKEKNYTDGKIDQRILRNIIGYRIPNQSLSSNDHLEVMGILPEEIGDTVIAYTGITTKTGSDFDIDKMYLMIPSFKAHYAKATDNNPYLHALNYLNDLEWSEDKLRSEIFKIGEAPSGKSLEDRTKIAKAMTEDSNYEYFESFRDASKIKSARKLEYVEIDPELSLFQQSPEALQNKLIEAYKGVLGNPAVYENLMNPIDVPHVKNDIKSMIQEEDQINLIDFSAVNDLKLKSNFRLGKTGLGQVINYLVDAVRGSMGELHFVEDGFSWGNHNEQNETVLDRRYSEKLSAQDQTEYIQSFNENRPEGVPAITKELMKDLEQLEITESFMGLVNGYVDIAKDEYVVKGNWTTKTNSLGLSLLRAGAHPFKINAFLAQPFLKEYMKFSDNLNSKNIDIKGSIEHLFKLDKLHNSFKTADDVEIDGEVKNVYELTKKLFNWYSISKVKFYNQARFRSSVDNAMTNIKYNLYKEFGLNSEKEDREELDAIMDSYEDAFADYFEAPPLDLNGVSLLDLRNQIIEKPDNHTQMGLFEVFLEWQKKAREVAKVVAVNKADVDGKGKNIASTVIKLNLANEVIDEPGPGEIAGYHTMLNFGGKPTIVNYSIVNGITNPFKIMQANPKFFPTASQGVVRTFNMIARFMEQNSLNDQTLGDKLEKAYYSYLMGGFKPLNMNNTQKVELIKNLPEELRIMKENYPNNVLVQELQLMDTPTAKKYYIGMSSNNKTSSTKNAITDGWLDMMDQEPEFSDRLVKYSYIESNFNNSISQFHEFIPFEWFNRNRLNSYLKSLNINAYEVDFNFIDQFFRNNFHNLEKAELTITDRNTGYHPADTSGDYLILGPKVTPKNEKFIKYMGAEKIAADEMEMAFDALSGTMVSGPRYKYYKFIGMTKENYPMYARTTPLGIKDAKGNRFEEYNIGSIENSYGLQTMFSQTLQDYLRDEGINIEKLKNFTNKYSNYILPKVRFYDDLNTRPIEAIDIEEGAELRVNTRESVVEQEEDEVEDTRTVIEHDPELQNRMTAKVDEVIKPSAQKWATKEKVKTAVATQYIGKGSEDSSTQRYNELLYGPENLSNTGVYTEEDIIWVSSNGKRSGRVNPVKEGKLQGVYKNIDKAIAANATIIMDTAKHLEKTSGYNIGEVALAEYLEDNGYERIEQSGMWQPVIKLNLEDIKKALDRKKGSNNEGKKDGYDFC